MSIPPLGWEQSVQQSPAQPSPAPCSSPSSDSTSVAGATLLPATQPPQLGQTEPARGFLNIVRHGTGTAAIYVVTYQRLDCRGVIPKPVLAEGARTLLDLLERLGVNLELKEVRGALEDILRLGSANIPDLWLSDEQMAERGLTED
jgi:hypothetical protein